MLPVYFSAIDRFPSVFIYEIQMLNISFLLQVKYSTLLISDVIVIVVYLLFIFNIKTQT